MLQDKAQSESLPAKTASAEVISTNSGGGDSETDAPVLLDKPASVPLKARRVLGGTTSEERLKEIRETFELHKAFSRDRHESKVQRVSTHTAACSATGSEKGVSTGADSSLPDETGPEPGIAMSPKEFKNFQGHRKRASSVPSYLKLPKVFGLLQKRSKWGQWQDRYVRVFKFAFYYSANESSVMAGSKPLRAMEASGRLRDGDLSMVPLDFVSGFHFAKDKIIIRLNKLTRRKEFVFQVPSKNPYEAAAWAKRLGEHLKHYVKHKEKLTGQDE